MWPNTTVNLLICILFFNICLTTVTSQNEGESCVEQLTGRKGTCKDSSYCPVELELVKLGLKPTVCQRQRNKFIICCADVSNPNPHPFSLIGNINDNDDDEVQFPDDLNTPVVTSTMRKSEQKCNEYTKLFTHTVQVIPLVTNPKPVSLSVPKCDAVNGIPLIVGGSPARPAEFPHMAALGYYSDHGIQWKCGSTLISEEFVVTAAHCTQGTEKVVRVRVGDVNLDKKPNVEAQEVGVAQVIVHPQYRPPKKYNDISLIRLSRPVTFTRFIIPACLRTSFDIPEEKAIVTGWGLTEFAGSSSTELMKVYLSLVSNSQCNKQYYSLRRQLPEGIRSTMLCAGEKAGGKDACQGDSGGPIQVVRPNNPCLFDLIGVTSFGKGCANPNTAGVYTRISEFVPWIERIVWS